MRIVVCASLEMGCLVAAITANLERFARLYVSEKRVIILQVDEIATEPRARYYAVTDEVRFAFRKSLLGLCGTHALSITQQQIWEVCLVCSISADMQWIDKLPTATLGCERGTATQSV